MSNLELHYYLDNNLHSMDAFVKNKSEAELLKLFTEITNLLDIEVDLEIEAIREGGIREVFKFLKKKKSKKVTKQILTVLGTIVLNVLVTLITNNISKDKDADERTKEEQILHIKYLKKQLESDQPIETAKIVNEMTGIIGEDYKVKVFKSRFYSQLLNDPNINQFSAIEVSSERKPISKEVSIQRNVFQKQILVNEDIEPISIENAEIEIVAPVLKTSEMKWRANYQGIPISFTLRDFNFKKSVLKKQYSFSNGTMIRCRLEIQQGINTKGDLYYKEVNVFDVSEVFDGALIIQTSLSKRKKESGSQAKLF